MSLDANDTLLGEREDAEVAFTTTCRRARRTLELLEARREGRPLGVPFPVLVSRPSCPVSRLELSNVHPVVAGPPRDPEEAGRYGLGRAAENDLAIDHVTVSRRHAALVLGHDREWGIVDLGSANGTFLDGVPLVGGRLARVAVGLAVVRVGPHARFALMDETAFASYLDGLPEQASTRRSPTRRARRPR